MSGIDALIEADRIILCGLAAYDEATSNITTARIAKARASMTRRGHSEEEIEAFEQEHHASVRAGRGRLHRELWTKALAAIAASQES